MIEMLDEIEAAPSSYPSAPSGLGDVPEITTGTAMPLEPAMIWARIEAWVRYRWTARSVTWIVTGPGDFNPPLTPVTATTSSERWDGAAWQTEALDASFMGGWILPGDGPYRIVADVGGGTVPEIVLQAYRRYHDYVADTPGRRLHTSKSVAAGSATYNWDKPELRLERAMVKSGAADLLRAFRRVK